MNNTIIYLILFLILPTPIIAQNLCKVKSPKMDIYSQPDINSLRTDVIYKKWSTLQILQKDGNWLKVKDETGNVCYILDKGNKLTYYQKDDSLLHQIANSKAFGAEMKYLIIYILIGVCVLWWILTSFFPKFKTNSKWALIFLSVILPISIFYIFLCDKYYINNWLFDNLFISTDENILYILKNVLFQLWNLILYIFFIFTLFLIFLAALKYLKNFTEIQWFDYTKRKLNKNYNSLVKIKNINNKLVSVNLSISIILPVVALILMIFSDNKNLLFEKGFFNFLLIGTSNFNDIPLLITTILISLSLLSMIASVIMFAMVMKENKLIAILANFLYAAFFVTASVSIAHSLICLSGNNFFTGLLILILVVVFVMVVITGLKEYNGSSGGGSISSSSSGGEHCFNCRWRQTGFGPDYCNRDKHPVKGGDWCSMHER